MDKIKLQEMAFYGHHGVDSEENTLGQRFFIDVEMDLDLSGAGESDNIEDSVNYAEVFSLVQSIAEGTPCKLLERVAGKINEEILVRYSKVEEVATTVHKPSVPIHGILKDVSVTLHKKKMKYFISMGSNEGPSEEIMGAALHKLSLMPLLSIGKVSSLYKTRRGERQIRRNS